MEKQLYQGDIGGVYTHKRLEQFFENLPYPSSKLAKGIHEGQRTNAVLEVYWIGADDRGTIFVAKWDLAPIRTLYTRNAHSLELLAKGCRTTIDDVSERLELLHKQFKRKDDKIKKKISDLNDKMRKNITALS